MVLLTAVAGGAGYALGSSGVRRRPTVYTFTLWKDANGKSTKPGGTIQACSSKADNALLAYGTVQHAYKLETVRNTVLLNGRFYQGEQADGNHSRTWYQNHSSHGHTEWLDSILGDKANLPSGHYVIKERANGWHVGTSSVNLVMNPNC